ncbi:hypothetical protein L9F63_004351 [Diploptera punctata]|uniref:Uncharacterized protein n=1 Tax=Diploptera punctata TaxID=6984 RepID=A0AAD7ZHF0_DIPPU|nr:hypothetical protein L9F63_004351 [Diploptera punctata]
MVPSPRCNVAPIELQVTSHFVYLHGTLQLLEKKILSDLMKAKNENTQNFQSLVNEVNSNLQQIKNIIQESVVAKEPGNLDKIDVAEITRKLLEVENYPCHLISNEINSTESLIRFDVNDTFLELLENHCELEIQDTSHYKSSKD